MPYKSRAQQGYMHAAAARGELSKNTVHEFDEKTKGHYQDLPEHVKKADLIKIAELVKNSSGVEWTTEHLGKTLPKSTSGRIAAGIGGLAGLATMGVGAYTIGKKLFWSKAK